MKLFRFPGWCLFCTVVLLGFLSFCPVTTTADTIAVPRPDHVVIVVRKNKGFDELYLSPNAPCINELARQGALFVSSYALTHPSQPDYLALFSVATQGITDNYIHTTSTPKPGEFPDRC